MLHAVNLVLRFLLEIAGLVAFAYWGWQTTAEPIPRAILAACAPLAMVVFWALVVAPKAKNQIPQHVRILIGTVVLLLAAGALALAGQSAVAVALAVTIVVNTALMFLLRD